MRLDEALDAGFPKQTWCWRQLLYFCIYVDALKMSWLHLLWLKIGSKMYKSYSTVVFVCFFSKEAIAATANKQLLLYNSKYVPHVFRTSLTQMSNLDASEKVKQKSGRKAERRHRENWLLTGWEIRAKSFVACQFKHWLIIWPQTTLDPLTAKKSFLLNALWTCFYVTTVTIV